MKQEYEDDINLQIKLKSDEERNDKENLLVKEEYKRKKSIKEAKRLLYLAKFPIVNGGAKNLFRTAASAGEIEGREGKGREGKSGI